MDKIVKNFGGLFAAFLLVAFVIITTSLLQETPTEIQAPAPDYSLVDNL